MVTLEFHDPSGAIAVKLPHAPRLGTLAGKRIGFVSNEQYWLQGYSPGVVGRPIALPASFERLLADAERDLGPR